MHLKNCIAMATLVVFATSCGESSTKTTDTADTVVVDNKLPENVSQPSPTTGTVVVPEPINATFTKKYPNVTNVTWNRYEPVDNIDWEWSGWPRMDTSDYVVRFNMDGNDYWEWYDQDNNWIGTVSSYTDFAGLPAAVNKTIQADFAGYTIVSVDKENDKNRTAYEVEMAKGEDKIKALIAENGTVIKKKGKVDGDKMKEKNM